MADIHSLGKSDIKINNRILVLNLIKEYHAISRIQLAKITNMSPTSMTRIVNDLKELNLVCEVDTASNPLGRKATMIAINKDAFYSLGVGVSKDRIRLTLIDSTYSVLYTQDYEKVLAGLSGMEIAESVYLKFPEFMFYAEEATSLELREDICCVGISFPGMVDGTHKNIITSPILGDDVKETLCYSMGRLFHLPVYVENDIKAALYNEYQRFGKKGEADLAYLYMDVGIGVALMVDGKIYRGSSFGAGEIAYASITKEQCGTFFNNLRYPYLLQLANDAGMFVTTLEEVAKRYEKGEKESIVLLSRASRWLSRILNFINVFYNPSKIIIGGSVIRDLPMLLPLALEEKDAYYDILFEHLQIVMAHEPTGGEVIGAATQALEEYLREKLTDEWY